MPLTPIGDVMIALKADASDLQKTAATSKESIGLITGSFRALSTTARNTGLALTAMGALGAGAMYKLATSAERVDNAYREVDTITDEVADSQEQFNGIVDDINTSFGLQAGKLEVIEGLYQAVSAGVSESREEMRNFLETSAQLAVVGRVDLGTAVDVVSTAINSYGEETMSANRASNALFRTVQFGKVRLEELAPVMGRVFALSSDLGVQIEDLGAAMAILTRKGFEARIAATGLRNILRQFLRPVDEMKDALFEVALDADLFAENFDKGSEAVRNLADDMRETTSAIEEQIDAMNRHGEAADEASQMISEARLLQMAAERGRLDEAKEIVNEELKHVDSAEEAARAVDHYRYQQKKASVQEKQAKRRKEDLQEELEEMKKRYSDALGPQADLDDGIGRLILKNMNLVEAFQELNKVTEESEMGIQDLFPRTRALQAATALWGESTEEVQQVLEVLTADGLEEAKRATDDLVESSEDFSQEEADELKSALPDIAELHGDVHDDAQRHRDAMSKLREAFRKFGEIIQEPVFNAIEDFGNTMAEVARRIDNLPKPTKEAIGKFLAFGAAFALVAGPLLFFGGQLALIAGAMGSAFIPMVLVAAAATGGLIGVFKDLMGASEDTKAEFDNYADKRFQKHIEEDKSSLEKLRGAFGKTIEFVRYLKSVFVDELLGPIKTFAAGVKAGLGAMADGINTVRDSDGEGFIRLFARAIGNLLERIGVWLQENEELIKQMTRLFAGIVKRLLPPIIDLIVAIGGVIVDMAKWIGFFMKLLGVVDEGESNFGAFVTTVFKVVDVIAAVIQGIADAMEKHSKWIALFALIIGSILLFTSVIIPAATAIWGFITSTLAAIKMLFGWVAVSVKVAGVMATLKSLFIGGAQAIGLFLGALTLATAGAIVSVARWIMSFEAFKRFFDTFVNTIIGFLMLVLDWFLLVPRMVKAFHEEGWSGVLEVLKDFGKSYLEFVGMLLNLVLQFFLLLWHGIGSVFEKILGLHRWFGKKIWGLFTEVLGSILEWVLDDWTEDTTEAFKSAGKDFIDALIGGIESQFNELKKTANDAAGVIDKYLPGSDAEEGPLSTLTAAGEAIPNTIAEGILNEKGVVDKTLTEVGKGVGEFGGAMKTGGSAIAGGVGGGGGTTVHVDEKAVYIAPGAIQGVSDEEIPQRVGEEMEQRLEEVLEDLSASGKDTPTR